jgi:hypothetical protein
LKPVSLEEIRHQARENWLQFRQQKIGIEKGVGHSKDAERSIKEPLCPFVKVCLIAWQFIKGNEAFL